MHKPRHNHYVLTAAGRKAARLLFKLKTRPSANEMLPLAEPWRPWRGAAACMLWTYYRTTKQRDGAPITVSAKKPGW